MLKQTKIRTPGRRQRALHFRQPHAARANGLLLTIVAATLMLSACGGGSSATSVNNVTLAGNWQFTLAPAPDGSFYGGPQGGFLLQNSTSATGSATYAVFLPGLPYPCNSGSAAITGAINGQSVTLTAVAGTQIFTLTGQLTFDGTTMVGTYSSTAGSAADGSPCGTVQDGLQWTANLVPPITGPVQGSFKSTGGAAGLNEQDFLVTGALSQAANSGAAYATVTGNLSFINASTNLSDYPCFASAIVSGQISGNVVNLQILGSDGSIWGDIGELPGSNGVTGINPVTFTSVQGTYVLNGAGPSYMVATTGCPGRLASTTTSGDYGNICLALGTANPCALPLTLTPAALSFPAQTVGSPVSMLNTTLANASSASIGGLSINLANTSGAVNFTETDNCGINGYPSLGQPFELLAAQSCVITINFAPLETCAPGTPPAQCPAPLTAMLSVNSPNNDLILTAPISGAGLAPDSGPARETDFDIAQRDREQTDPNSRAHIFQDPGR